MSKDIYIYSGIQPGKKGTGNFLSFFIEKFHQNNIDFKLISYNTPNVGFVAKLAKKLGLIKVLRSVYFSLIRTSPQQKIKDAIVFIFHPQSIGLSITADLIKNNKTYIYVLDTFFFCKKSYNHLEGNEACFQCITNPKASKENNCKFFLSNQSDENYHNFQKAIYENLETICFLTQNDNQGLLLKAKFGPSINTRKLGMLINLKDEFDIKNKADLNYDFVYHNTNLKAKGVEYFIKLAQNMPEYRFLMPYEKSELNMKSFQNLKNIDFIPMTWETGLKNAIVNSKIILNPSLWSSPVEGALLKSIKFNGCVAVVPIDFSFQKEIPRDVVIHLYESIDSSVQLLQKMIISQTLMDLYKHNSSKWLASYQRITENNFDDFLKESGL